MPFANTYAMQKHLMEISRAVAPGACAPCAMLGAPIKKATPLL
jgi:hypothetical protein